MKSQPIFMKKLSFAILITTVFLVWPCTFTHSMLYGKDSFHTLPFPSVICSMAFHEVSVEGLLKAIAQEHGVNVIMPDGIDRKISVNFSNISLSDAFKSILSTSGLDYIVRGNIIEVDTQENIRDRVTHLNKKMDALVRGRDLERELSELETRIFFLKYSVNPRPTVARDLPRGGKIIKNLNDLAKTLQNEMLTQRGKVDVIEDKNSLIVTDIPSVLDKVASLLEKIDAPPFQIAIEARIVDVSDDYVKEIGVQWGGSFRRGDFTATGGQTTNVQEGGEVQGTGPATGGVGLSQDNYIVNLPATVGILRGGSIGFLLTDGENFNLDLQLSALEEDKKLNVISRPRIITLDNHRAYIESGQEIPYKDYESEITGGFSVEFKKAALQMEVTPHVLDEKGRIMLDIVVADKKANFAQALLVGGEPPLDTRSLTTKVIVKNRNTVVIGGLKREEEQKSTEGVPFFSKIPLFGRLFKFTGSTTRKSQLMIFITPIILNKEGEASDV